MLVGYLYLTADTGCSKYGHSPPCFCPNECPNPWNTIGSYLSTEMSYINVGSVTSTIQAVDKVGTPLSASVIIKYNGLQARQATTPFTYLENSGWTFVLDAQAKTGYTLCYWGTNTADPMTISPT